MEAMHHRTREINAAGCSGGWPPEPCERLFAGGKSSAMLSVSIATCHYDLGARAQGDRYDQSDHARCASRGVKGSQALEPTVVPTPGGPCGGRLQGSDHRWLALPRRGQRAPLQLAGWDVASRQPGSPVGAKTRLRFLNQFETPSAVTALWMIDLWS
jgi:hypothetical protein